MAAEPVIPTGKGKPRVAVSQATDAQLATFVTWWEGLAADDETAARWEPSYYAAKATQEARAHGRAPAAQAPAQQASAPPPRQAEPPAAKPASAAPDEPDAPTRSELALAATYDPGVVSERLQRLSSQYHLVSPANEVADLPPGFGVTVSLVKIDPNTDKGGPGEVYDVGGGKVGLAKVAIERIGAAAGVDWDPHLTRRQDNGKDPHYVHYLAVGYVKNFDGSLRRISGAVEIDARQGSPQLEEILTKAARRKEKYPNDYNDGGASQTLELRKFILRHAETKAKLRAILSIGVKRAYNKSELSKPFAVASLIFTGHTDDPELRRTFALMKAQAALQGANSLFGPPPQISAFTPAHDPPPLARGGQVIDAEYEDPDDEDLDGDDMDPDLGGGA